MYLSEKLETLVWLRFETLEEISARLLELGVDYAEVHKSNSDNSEVLDEQLDCSVIVKGVTSYFSLLYLADYKGRYLTTEVSYWDLNDVEL